MAQPISIRCAVLTTLLAAALAAQALPQTGTQLQPLPPLQPLLQPKPQPQPQLRSPLAKRLPLESLQVLAASFQIIRTDYVTPMAEDRLINACTRGMFKELDSASTFLEADAFNDLTSQRQTDTVGIGIELVHRAGLPTIVTTHEGSPAERAGLRPRDYLLDIDGESLEETELAQAIAKLKGKPGTELTLTIRRPGESAPRTLKLVRQPVVFKPVTGLRWAGDLGYLRVRGLTDKTADELRSVFRDLQQGGKLKGLVLDLRRSPGGLLETSIEVAAMFLPEQAVVTRTEGRIPEANHTYTADRRNSRARGAWPEDLTQLPLVVLVDGGTASGAEIIAAALRDNGRAKLLGSKTFGRGSIQTVRKLSANSGVKLTTAVYRTPGGQLLLDRGLQPDEALPDLDQLELAGSDQDPALPRARALLAGR